MNAQKQEAQTTRKQYFLMFPLFLGSPLKWDIKTVKLIWMGMGAAY